MELKPHHDHWEKFFQETRARLQALLCNYDPVIEHVGSTSIKGLDAKPIIDIAIGIPNILLIGEIVSTLEQHGFIYRGDSGSNGGFLLVKESEKSVRTHHIHIVDLQDEQWTNYLFFRDQLRANQELCTQYQALKKHLALQFKEDRRSYTAGKEEFIRKVIAGK